jgi:hypothetical protein
MGNLSYLAADALNIPLTKDRKSEALSGFERKPFTFGPWHLDVWVHVRQDIHTNKEVGLFVSMTKRLWAYLMVDSRYTRLHIFDAIAAGINLDNSYEFGGSHVKGTLEKLQPYITATFSYDEVGWRRLLPKVN